MTYAFDMQSTLKLDSIDWRLGVRHAVGSFSLVSRLALDISGAVAAEAVCG